MRRLSVYAPRKQVPGVKLPIMFWYAPELTSFRFFDTYTFFQDSWW